MSEIKTIGRINVEKGIFSFALSCFSVKSNNSIAQLF